ncbi:MAG: TIGR00730 family Rossman fold protein [Bacteroidota bacterium]
MNKSEIKFLEGPQSRWQEFTFTVKIMLDFIRGFRALHFAGPCVTIFGSARFKEDHPDYIKAREIGQEMAKLGFTVMTGGGPGIMEAANRGAKDAGGRSIGCNIVLPMEQSHNPYLDHWVNIRYFFVRKTLLIKYSYGFIVMPGGFGTMDEYFEALTLIQTGKIQQFPVVLFDKEYHAPLMAFIEKMKAERTISPDDMSLFLFTDSVEEAITFIREKGIHRFGLTYRKPKPNKLLWERWLNGHQQTA